MPTLTGKQHAFVAAYLGEANRNATEAARMAGYKHPQVQGTQNLQKLSVSQAIAEWRDEIKSHAITLQEYRIARIADLEQRCALIIAERADEMAGEAPGGASGLLVRQKKVIRSGDDVTIEYQYVVDTGLIKELRELLKHAAIETGQWTENKNVRLTTTDEYIVEVSQKYGIDPAALIAELEAVE
jgi:phage terminase small subunit